MHFAHAITISTTEIRYNPIPYVIFFFISLDYTNLAYTLLIFSYFTNFQLYNITNYPSLIVLTLVL